jgi:hypothetical protein
MTSKNPITGDKLQTKPSTKEYRDGWEAIFGKAGYPSPASSDLESPKECCGKGCNKHKETTCKPSSTET